MLELLYRLVDDAGGDRVIVEVKVKVMRLSRMRAAG